jgi:hypothetical protein
MRGRFTPPYGTSRDQTTAQVRGAAGDWVVGLSEGARSAVSGKGPFVTFWNQTELEPEPAAVGLAVAITAGVVNGLFGLVIVILEVAVH